MLSRHPSTARSGLSQPAERKGRYTALPLIGRPRNMKISNFSAIALIVALLAGAGSASAAGCLKGAVVGGVAGHYAGHHAVVGAIGGCVVGHHLAKKRAQEEAAAAKAQTNMANAGRTRRFTTKGVSKSRTS